MFSIIIPIYNVEPYLRECLDSVRAQTFTDWECLCVDDGSTDGSGAILDDYASKDSRFRVFHKPNGGVSSARNLALDNASGEWVWFVDGDDALHPDALSAIQNAVVANPGTRTVLFSYHEGMEPPSNWQPEDNVRPVVYPSPCDEGLYRFGYGMCAYAMRRDSIGGLRFERFPRGEDSVFLFDYARNGFGLVDLQRKLYFYRQRRDSATHSSPTIEIVSETLNCQRRQVENLAETVARLGNIRADRIWGGYFRNCYKTYYGMFFRLSPPDRRRLLDQWLSLLALVQAHYRPPLETRVRIGLIRLTRSGRFVRRLAFGWIPGLNGAGRLFRSARRLLAKMKLMRHPPLEGCRP